MKILWCGLFCSMVILLGWFSLVYGLGGCSCYLGVVIVLLYVMSGWIVGIVLCL